MILLTYENFILANNEEYLKNRPEVKRALIENEKEFKPESCVCCIMFRWLFGEDRTICGGRCSAKPEIEKEKFIEIEKGKKLNAAHERRVEGCPLEDDTDEK